MDPRYGQSSTSPQDSKADKDSVILLKEDGKTLTVPVEKLSSSDKEYLTTSAGGEQTTGAKAKDHKAVTADFINSELLRGLQRAGVGAVRRGRTHLGLNLCGIARIWTVAELVNKFGEPTSRVSASSKADMLNKAGKHDVCPTENWEWKVNDATVKANFATGGYGQATRQRPFDCRSTRSRWPGRNDVAGGDQKSGRHSVVRGTTACRASLSTETSQGTVRATLSGRAK